MTRILSLTVGLVGALSGNAFAADLPAGVPSDYRLLFAQDFQKEDALKELVFRDPTTWKHAEMEGGGLELAYDKKKYKPAAPRHRSPYHIALIADRVFTDLVMDLEMQSTVAPYGHQDMCLFFGFESPERFYYAAPRGLRRPARAQHLLREGRAPRRHRQ